MSDGPSDAAAGTHAQALKWVAENLPGVKVVEHMAQVPLRGKVALIFEMRLDHVIEYIVDRVVVTAYRTKLTGGPGKYKHEVVNLKPTKIVKGSRYYAAYWVDDED